MPIWHWGIEPNKMTNQNYILSKVLIHRIIPGGFINRLRAKIWFFDEKMFSIDNNVGNVTWKWANVTEYWYFTGLIIGTSVSNEQHVIIMTDILDPTHFFDLQFT